MLFINRRYSTTLSKQWVTKNPLVDNQEDLFMHFLSISRNGQVATDGNAMDEFFFFFFFSPSNLVYPGDANKTTNIDT